MTSAAPDQPGIFSTITFWGRIVNAQSWLRQFPRNGVVRPLWLSEFGWSVCTCGNPNCPPHTVPSEWHAAVYLARAYGIALALGVQHASYFQLEDKFDGDWGHPCEDAAGILGTAAANYRTKPAFTAYQTISRQLTGASFRGLGPAHTHRYDPTDQNYSGVYHLQFNTPNRGRVDMLWKTVGEQTISLNLQSGWKAEIIELGGASRAISGKTVTLTIGESPIYLRQTPP